MIFNAALIRLLLIAFLNLIELVDKSWEKDGTRKLRVDEKPDEVQGVIETSHVLQDACDCIDLSLIDVVGHVELELLIEIDSWSRSKVLIGEEGRDCGLHIEKVGYTWVKETEEAVTQVDDALF